MAQKNSFSQSPARASKPKQNPFKRLALNLLLTTSILTSSLLGQPVKQIQQTAVKKQTYTQDQLTFYKDAGMTPKKKPIDILVSSDYLLETGWFDKNRTFCVVYQPEERSSNYFGHLQTISSPEQLPEATFQQFLQYIGASKINQKIIINIQDNTYESKEPAQVEHLNLTPLLKPMPTAMKALDFAQLKPPFKLTTYTIENFQVQVLTINNTPVAIALGNNPEFELSQTGGSDNIPESSLISPKEAHLYIIHNSHPIPSKTAVLLLKGISTRYKDSNYPAVSMQWENTEIDKRMGKPSTFMYELIVKNAFTQLQLKEFKFYYTNSKWDKETMFGSLSVIVDCDLVHVLQISMPNKNKTLYGNFREGASYLATKTK